MHHYTADVVGRWNRQSDWNNDWQTPGCVAGPWQ